jgi:hypothetical protein
VNKKKLIFGALIFGVFGLLIVWMTNPFAVSNLLTSYKTQTVLFENMISSKLTIELQMKDIGALGYKRRIVKVERGFFMNQNTIIDTANIDKKNWKFVNKHVNELGLKGG